MLETPYPRGSSFAADLVSAEYATIEGFLSFGSLVVLVKRADTGNRFRQMEEEEQLQMELSCLSHCPVLCCRFRKAVRRSERGEQTHVLAVKKELTVSRIQHGVWPPAIVSAMTDEIGPGKGRSSP